MKRFVKYIIVIVAAVSLTAAPARAQGDATILTPLLEAWRETQMGKFTAQAKAMIDELNVELSHFETAKNMASNVGKAYNMATAFTTGYEEIYSLYKECEMLYTKSIYTYDYLQRQLSDGNITLSEVSYILGLLDYYNNYGQKILKDISDLFTNPDLSFEFKLAKLRENMKRMEGLSNSVDDEIQKKEEAIADQKELASLEGWFKSAYGLNVDDVNRIVITDAKAKQDVKKVQEELAKKNGLQANNAASSGSGQEDAPATVSTGEVNSTATGISKMGTAVLNWVSVAVGLLFILMAVPTYMRKNQGHQQSQDAIMKLFRGTIIIIIAIQIVGRVLFAIS